MSTTRMIGRAYPTRLAASRMLALTAASWRHHAALPDPSGASAASHRRRQPALGAGRRDEALPAPDEVVPIDLMRYGL